MTTIFAYGTLRSALVRKALLERDHPTQEGVFVKGFEILPVSHGKYPAVIKSTKMSENDVIVVGTLIFDVTSDEMAILDLFEDEYIHQKVFVNYNNTNDLIEATMYLWNASESQLDKTRLWSYEIDFEAHEEHRQVFIANTIEFRCLALSRLE
jgi:gamma-glutamylcyclotransferase (GGCT)/AIG2-like uncharacterized protein YtfP